MFAIVVVVTLADYVIPIVIVGGIVWVALMFWLRGHRLARSHAAPDTTSPRDDQEVRREVSNTRGRRRTQGISPTPT